MSSALSHIVLVLCCWTSCVINSMVIQEGPSDMRVKIGSDVTLNCTIVEDVATEYVRWVDHESASQYISQGDSIIPASLSVEQKDRFSIEHDTSPSPHFNLKITRVLHSDSSTYECVYMQSNDYTWRRYSFSPRAIAILTVLKEPSGNSPECMLRDAAGDVVVTDNVLRGDGVVNFLCSSYDHASTIPNLTLFISDVAEPNTEVTIDAINIKTVTSRTVHLRQGIEFRCVLESEALLTEIKTCLIRPNVEPVVRIHPDNVTLPVSTALTFECIASGFRNDTLQYKWDILPEFPGTLLLDSLSQSTVQLIDIKQQVNGSVYLIMCTVLSDNGTYNASATLKVTQSHSPPAPTSKRNDKSHSILAIVLTLFVITTIVITALFIWRRRTKAKMNRFTGLRYTIEPSTNANTNVPINYASQRSENIYGTEAGAEPVDRPISRSSSIKDNLYARFKKRKKPHEAENNTAEDPQVLDTVRAIIVNHRLSDIDGNLVGADVDECLSLGLQQHDSEDECHSNDTGNYDSGCTPPIYENVTLKEPDST